MSSKVTSRVWESLLTDLADLLEAGIDLGVALAMIAGRTGAARHLAEKLREKVLSGERVTVGLEKLGCPALTLCIVKTGEETGELELAMAKAGMRLAEKRSRRERVRSLFFYPAALSLVCVAVVYLLAAVVLPDFDRMFRAFRLHEGLYTVILFGAGDVVAKGGPIFGMSMALLAAGICTRRKSTGAWLETWLLRSRATRPLWQLIRSRDAFEGLSALLDGGVDLFSAVRFLAAQDQPSLRPGWVEVARVLESGETLSAALRQWVFIRPEAAEIVYLSEQTGDLPRGTARADQYIERTLGRLAERVVQMAEPTATVVLGLVVGGATLLFMMPMLDLVRQLS